MPNDPEDIEAVALLDEPVRRRLYDWLTTRAEAVSRDQAAAGVGITRALAAFHLDRLVAASLLVAEYRRLSGRTGSRAAGQALP
jgi:predicted ArsR family transcriptional regulator